MKDLIKREGIVELTGASASQIYTTTNRPQFPEPRERLGSIRYWDVGEVMEFFVDNPIRTISDRRGAILEKPPQIDNDMATAFITGKFGARR